MTAHPSRTLPVTVPADTLRYTPLSQRIPSAKSAPLSWFAAVVTHWARIVPDAADALSYSVIVAAAELLIQKPRSTQKPAYTAPLPVTLTGRACVAISAPGRSPARARPGRRGRCRC